METRLKVDNDQESGLLKSRLVSLILNTPDTPKQVLIDTFLAFMATSKRDLARELNLSHTTVNQVLSGKLKSGKSVEKVFKAIGIKNPYDEC